MNNAIELHDSVVESINVEAEFIRLSLRAYIHRSGSVFFQEVVIEFVDGQLAGTVGELPADIWSGELTLGTVIHHNMIQLPFESTDEVSLRLCLHSDFLEVILSGTQMRLTLTGEARYVEEFPF